MEHEGDLEVCLFDIWGSVCDGEWTKADSNVACRQLGFTTGNSSQFATVTIDNWHWQLHYQPGMGSEVKAATKVIDECTTPVHLFNVTCSGEEQTLTDCSHNMTTASRHLNNHTCGIFLSCPGTLMKYYNISTRFHGALIHSETRLTCRDGDLKLLVFEKMRPNKGWLLICLNKKWGTICDTSWDFLDSTVACKQLGYIGGFHGKSTCHSLANH